MKKWITPFHLYIYEVHFHKNFMKMDKIQVLKPAKTFPAALQAQFLVITYSFFLPRRV